MAKRRKLTTPSAGDLERIDAELRRERGPGGPERSVAPIAHVAGEAASHSAIADTETRAEAAAHRDARARGLLMAEVPLDQIEAEALVRDRTVLDDTEMEELRRSIMASGLRLPIEIYPLENTDPDSQARYGLLSGYRRLLAMRSLHAQARDQSHSTIKALIRPGRDAAASFGAMVEENEIRANLSHFERGRIAVIAARSGAFDDVGAAVNQLFANASRAKRSKVRSFAQIFEELGDVLAFPEALTEKQGLRLAAALRVGAAARLKAALSMGPATDAETEWQRVLPVVEKAETRPRDPARGGRPSQTRPGPTEAPPEIKTPGGVTLSRESDGEGHLIRVSGPGITVERIDRLMQDIASLLEED